MVKPHDDATRLGFCKLQVLPALADRADIRQHRKDSMNMRSFDFDQRRSEPDPKLHAPQLCFYKARHVNLSNQPLMWVGVIDADFNIDSPTRVDLNSRQQC